MNGRPGLASVRRCLCQQITKWTPLLASRGRPIQAVLLAGIALELCGVHAGGLAVVSLLRVALLRGDVGTGGCDRLQLVASDPPRQHFFLAGGGVESPSVCRFDERHRERPVLVADDERLLIGLRILEMPLLSERNREHPAVHPSGRGIG